MRSSVTHRVFRGLRQTLLGVFIALLTATPATTVFAEETDLQFYSGNNILFYDPNAKDGTCESASSVSLEGNENLEKIFNYMKSKGLSDVQAAGVVGNISQESGGDPTIVQGGGHSKDPATVSGGWGIIQWTPGRKVIGLAKEAGATGPIHELATQLDIVWGHMNNKPPITTGKFAIAQYKKFTNVEKATDYFEHHIEGAGKPNMVNRYAAARLALTKYGGEDSTSSAIASTEPLTNCSDGSAGGAAGKVAQTAINYAWPNRSVSPPTKKKPSYAQAIAAAKAKGKYTGDTCFGDGVDCGAFITRAVQDSGVDPNYGGGGNTRVQLAYARSHPEIYEEIKPSTTGDLRPGDIAIRYDSGGHHTYMYVGEQPGFGSKIASASQCEHAPWAGTEKPADPKFTWFRIIKGGSDALAV